VFSVVNFFSSLLDLFTSLLRLMQRPVNGFIEIGVSSCSPLLGWRVALAPAGGEVASMRELRANVPPAVEPDVDALRVATFAARPHYIFPHGATGLSNAFITIMPFLQFLILGLNDRGILHPSVPFPLMIRHLHNCSCCIRWIGNVVRFDFATLPENEGCSHS
jgi:hypothetical protein